MSRARDNALLSTKILNTVGGLVTADSDSLETLSPGATNQVLTVDLSLPNKMKWATPTVNEGLPIPATNNYVLTADLALPTKVKWAAAPTEIPTPTVNTQFLSVDLAEPTKMKWVDAPDSEGLPVPSVDDYVLTSDLSLPSKVKWVANGTPVLPTPSVNNQILSVDLTEPTNMKWVDNVGSSEYDTVVHIVSSSYGTGLVDASTEIQSKITLASNAGGGTVVIPRGTYLINTTLTIPSYVTLVGQGMDVTKLKLKTGANQSVINTTDTASLMSGNTPGGAKYWGISDLTIDGNKANNTAGHGIYSYSRTFKIDRVKIKDAKERGIYTKWCGACAAWDNDASDMFMEAMVNDVYIQGCGKEGLYYDGPHDGRLTNVLVALSSQTTSGSYDGIYVGPNAGGTVFTTCHSWGDYQRYDWNISSGWIYCANCIADDAYTAGVYVNADKFSWVGGHVFGAVWNTPPTTQDLAMKGFILTANAWHPYIQTMATDVPGGVVDFTNAPNGSGTVIISGSVSGTLNTYGNTYGYVGTPPAYLNVQIQVFDPDNNDFYYSSTAGGSAGVFGNGGLIDRPYENYVTTGGSDGWPDRTTPENSLLKVGLGTSATPRTVIAGDAPTGIFMQNYVKPNFTGDAAAYYVGGANFDTIVSGGIGGCTSFSSTAYKMPGTYTGDVGIVGGRIGADARDATHYGGIITGFWAFVHGDRAGSGGIAPSIEINSFCNQSWNTTTNYSVDPFATNGKRSVMGLLINNYQSAVTEYGGSAGDYQNTFGVCLTSLGPGGTNGRAFGYQTGMYLSDCSKENIRIRGGVYGGTGKSDYGIKLEGNAMNIAGIALGPNKFNWGTGSGAGSASNNGDMLYNDITGILYMNQLGIVGEIPSVSEVVSTATNNTINRKLRVKINGVWLWILASTGYD